MTLKDWKDLFIWCADRILAIASVCFVVIFLLSLSPLLRDDTDPGNWGARSGVMVATDAATGCQYLRAPGGGITPRLTAIGEHMGCRR